jgi:hypothetical protein
MSLTILNRIDIDIDWYFSAVSVGFTIHKRGFQLSLIFFDISVYYFSPKWRQSIADRYKRYQKIAEELDQA